ncbi:unnamed protein product [Polarella glacialis]|uniref:Uncharacterized protein n=1 Tax=Polarella glacialis TaxID=89957 RepID=A0A813IPG1_POLGL|nr:unnamed protein product [Polarella glacialis]
MLTPSTVIIFFIDSVVFISVSFLSSLSCPRDWNSLEGGKPFRSDSLDWAIPIRTESKFAQLPVIAFVCWFFFVVGFVVFVFVRVVVFCFFLCFVLVLLFLFLLLLVLLCLLCCFPGDGSAKHQRTEHRGQISEVPVHREYTRRSLARLVV